MADHYVNFDATNNGDGTTWTDAAAPGGAGAWNQFTAAEHASVSAGDFVWFKPGNSTRKSLSPKAGSLGSWIHYCSWPSASHRYYESRPSGPRTTWDPLGEWANLLSLVAESHNWYSGFNIAQGSDGFKINSKEDVYGERIDSTQYDPSTSKGGLQIVSSKQIFLYSCWFRGNSTVSGTRNGIDIDSAEAVTLSSCQVEAGTSDAWMVYCLDSKGVRLFTASLTGTEPGYGMGFVGCSRCSLRNCETSKIRSRYSSDLHMIFCETTEGSSDYGLEIMDITDSDDDSCHIVADSCIFEGSSADVYLPSGNLKGSIIGSENTFDLPSLTQDPDNKFLISLSNHNSVDNNFIQRSWAGDISVSPVKREGHYWFSYLMSPSSAVGTSGGVDGLVLSPPGHETMRVVFPEVPWYDGYAMIKIYGAYSSGWSSGELNHHTLWAEGEVLLEYTRRALIPMVNQRHYLSGLDEDIGTGSTEDTASTWSDGTVTPFVLTLSCFFGSLEFLDRRAQIRVYLANSGGLVYIDPVPEVARYYF